MTSKEKLLTVIDQANQPNPEAQQQAQMQAQAQMELQQAQTAVLMAQAEEAKSRAAKYAVESDLMPKEAVLKYSDQDKDGKIDDDFEKKIRIAQMMMDEDKWNVEKQERMASMANAQSEQELLQKVLGDQPQLPAEAVPAEESLQ